MNPYTAGALLAALAVIQTTVMESAALGAVRPLLPLLAVVSWALHRGALAATWWGLGGGLLLDLVSGQPMGTYAVPLVAAAAVVAPLGNRLYPTNLALPIAVTAAATLAFDLTQRALITLRGQSVAWSPGALLEEAVPAILLNLLWLPVVYFPLRAIARSQGPRIDWET